MPASLLGNLAWVEPALALTRCNAYMAERITEMSMASTITSKGQVTIPKPVRDWLGIQPGSVVNFELAPDGRVVLVKAGGGRRMSRFTALRGGAGPGLSTDEIMALTRGEK